MILQKCNVLQSTLSKADTLGTKATVRLREVSALERVQVTWYLKLQIGFRTVYNDHMTGRMRLFYMS